MHNNRKIMQISIEGVEPAFMEKFHFKNSEIWSRNISIPRGKHLHIVAPSGSGKTSFIQFIYGLNNNYHGQIMYDSKKIKEFSAEEFSGFRQTNISIVFQDLKLFADKTVRENIEIKRILNPYHPEEMIEIMAGYLGIKSKLDQVIKTCSYGEQQRTAIIRALMQPFDFLLLDEPFSHLDDLNQTKAMELIYAECAKRNASMILANLNEEAFSKNERVLFL